MTKRRRLVVLGAILGVPLVLVAILLLYLNFADLSGWRDTVAKLASDAVGRELRIEGEFQPEIGFTTRVVATNITLASPPWSKDPHMVSVDRLEGEIDLLSILFGPITIRDVEINGARVLFETSAKGQFNWALGDGKSDGGSGGEVELVISHALLNDVELTYAAPQSQVLDLALSNLEFTNDGTGMLDLELAGTFDQSPVEISGRLGTFIGLINANRVEHDLTGRYADAEFALQGSIEDLSSLSGVEGNASASGPALSRVTSAFGLDPIFDDPFAVEISVQSVAGGTDVVLEASVGEMSANIDGTVESLRSPSSLDVTVDAKGPDVAAIAALVGVDDVPAKPFAVSGRVQWAGFPLTCENVAVRVGDNTLSAHGVIGEPPLMLGTNFTFDGEGPDISAVAALAGLETPQDRFSIGGRIVRIEEGLQIENVEFEVGDVTLEANGRIGDPPEYHGTALTLHARGPDLARLEKVFGTQLPAEPFEITGRLVQGDGAIDLEGVRGLLGRTSVRVDGQLATEAGLAGSDLRLQVEGPDASQIAAFAGFSDVPAEQFSVASRVQMLDQGFRLRGFVASLGSLGVTINGVVANPPRLIGSDLQIHIEDLDLSHPATIAGITGLPRDAFSIDTRLRIQESGYRLDGLAATVGDIELKVDGLIGAQSGLDGTQAHVGIRGPQLSSLGPYIDQPGLPAAAFSMTGNAQITEGSIALDSVVAEVGDNRVTVNGTVLPSQGLVGTNLQIEASVPDLGNAGRLAAGFTELPELPAEPLTLETGLRIDEAGFEIEKLRATLGDAVASFDGRVGVPPNFLGTDLTIDSNGPNASLFTALTGVTIPVAPFRVRGRVQRAGEGFQFDRLSVQLGKYTADAHGSLGEPPHFVGTDVELRAAGPSLAMIGELAGREGLPNQPFRFEGRFEGTPERFTTNGLEVALGASDLRGSFEVNFRDKPAITAKLTSNRLDLSSYVKPLDEIVDEETEDEDAPETAPAGTVISDELIDFSPLQRIDASVNISVGTLQFPLKVLSNVVLVAKLTNGRLEIERLAAVGQGEGRIDGNFLLEPTRDGYLLRTGLDARQLRLDIPGSPVERSEQPPFDIDIDLEAVGATPHELASSADGAIQLVIGKGVMDSQVLDLVTADILLTLLDAFNPFSKQDAATELQCGVALLSFEDGLATLEPMAFQSDKMTLLGDGKIDLGTEKLNLEWVTKPRKGIGISASMITNPYIKLGGTLAKPAIEVKPMEAVAQTGAAVATLGLSLVAKGMYDRVTAEKKVCKKALEEIGQRDGGSPQKTKKKK